MSTATERKRQQRKRDREYEALRLRCEQARDAVAEGEWDYLTAMEFCFECAVGREYEWLFLRVAS